MSNHNTLQGVGDPEAGFGGGKQNLLNEWIASNAKRYWLSSGGPLAPSGAEVVIIDDPQMPALILIIKKVRPEAKIINCCHIQVRSDLVDRPGSPQEQVWRWVWSCITGGCRHQSSSGQVCSTRCSVGDGWVVARLH